MSAEPKRILIVENDPLFARVIRVRLEAEDYLVSVACDGWEGYEFAQREKFDLVVTDYDMPRMNGVHLCRHLRADQCYTETPIILVTGFSLNFARLQKQHQITACFSKPLDTSDLLDKVKELLSGVPTLAMSNDG